MLSSSMQKAELARAEFVVEAPPGPLGLELTDSPFGPAVKALAPSSPLCLDVGVGWLLTCVDKVPTKLLGCQAAAAALRHKEDAPTRRLVFLDRALLKGGGGPVAAPAGFVEVQAPPGRLGIELDMAPGAGGGGLRPTLISMRNASPLARLVRTGWQLVAIDGVDMTAATAKECARALGAAAERPRALTFYVPPPPPQPSVAKSLGDGLLFVAYYAFMAAFVVLAAAVVVPPEHFTRVLDGLTKVLGPERAEPLVRTLGHLTEVLAQKTLP